PQVEDSLGGRAFVTEHEVEGAQDWPPGWPLSGFGRRNGSEQLQPGAGDRLLNLDGDTDRRPWQARDLAPRLELFVAAAVGPQAAVRREQDPGLLFDDRRTWYPADPTGLAQTAVTEPSSKRELIDRRRDYGVAKARAGSWMDEEREPFGEAVIRR